ncbi:MAG: hypothetical protein SOZ94_08610 [Prevotella sp.]|nr:hypothetical protein [Prevotella sp.]
MALPPAAPHIAAFSPSGITAFSPSHCRKQPHTARNYDSGIISQRIYDSKADTMWTTALT